MTISYFISVPSFKSTAFVVWILARGSKFAPSCFNGTSEPPCTIGLRESALCLAKNLILAIIFSYLI